MFQAAKWQLIANSSTIILGLLQVSFLARVLTSSDFGLAAILSVVLVIAQVFSDMGMSNYLVHRQDLTQRLNSTIFWVSLAAGCLITFIVFILAPFISKLYSEESLTYLIQLGSLNFIFLSLGSQLQARYIGGQQLVLLGKLEIVSRLIGTVITITLGWLGWGVQSIPLGMLSTTVSKSLFLWILSPASWRPSFLFSFSDAKKSWHYGFYLVGAQLLNQFRANFDILIIGFFTSSTDLGYYSLAKQIPTKISAFIGPVVHRLMLPEFAKVQSDRVLLRNLLRNSLGLVSIAVTLPYLLCVFLAEPLTTLLFGTDYQPVVTLLIPISIFWLLRTIGGALVGPLTQGIGRTDLDFKWNLMMLIINLIVVAVAAAIGILQVAWSLVLMQISVMFMIYVVFFKNIADISIKEYFGVISLTITVGIMAVSIGLWIASNLTVFHRPLIFIVASCLFSFLIYYMMIYNFQNESKIIPSPYKIIRKVIKLEK